MHMQRMTERNAHLDVLRRRYSGRAKGGKSRLLEELCEQYGYERKYAIKLLKLEAERRVAKFGHLAAKARRELPEGFEALDPFELAQEVERRLKPILGAALSE